MAEEAELHALVNQARSNDQHVRNDAYRKLLAELQPQVRRLSRSYGWQLAPDEQESESHIALMNAVRDFNPERSHSFAAFFAFVMKRKFITRYKQTRKRRPTASIHEPHDDAELADIIPAKEDSSLEDHQRNEFARLVWQHVRTLLSERELAVFRLSIQGFTYREIIARLKDDFHDIDFKSVDNSLSRCHQKFAAVRIGLRDEWKAYSAA